MIDKSFRENLYEQVYQESVGPDIKTFKNLFPNKYNLSKDLFDFETELVTDYGPRRKYGAGVLFPQRSMLSENETTEINDIDNAEDEFQEINTEIDAEDNDSLFDEDTNFNDENDDTDRENDEEQSISLANQFLPSSMGMTIITDFSDDIEIISKDIGIYNHEVTIEDEIIKLLFLENIRFEDSNTFFKNFGFEKDNFYNELAIDDNIFGNIISAIKKIVRNNINEKTDKKLISIHNEVISLNDEEIKNFLNDLLLKYRSFQPKEKFFKNINGYLRKSETINFILSSSKYLNSKENFTIEKNFEELNLKLHIEGRTYKSHQGLFFITISIINNIIKTYSSGEKPKIKNEECFFQVKLTAKGKNNKNCFLAFKSDFETILAQENKSNRKDYHALIYDLYNSNFLNRDKKNYAIGHGCSCNWDLQKDDKCNQITTDTLPKYFDKPVEPNQSIELSMYKLSNDINYLNEKINELIKSYEGWIDQSTKIQTDLTDSEKFFFDKNLKKCEEVNSRIVEGLSILTKGSKNFNPIALKAFQLMNEAMLMQQCHYHIVENGLNGQKNYWNKEEFKYSRKSFPVVIDNYFEYSNKINRGYWRPFQLAFVLITIKSIINKGDLSRNLVDLIWFPTGGGKTEAYLGLSSFTIFYNKLINSKSYGNYILMRYTLRLLTGQQFQRAQSLICSMEIIRKNNISLLGEKEISIGLFVGGKSSPNLKDRWRKIKEDIRDKGKKTNLVLLNCPWCGTEMGPVQIDSDNLSTKGYGDDGDYFCENSECDFHEKLPIYTVDEVLYIKKPSMIIATVDKFAITPWKYKNVKKLFFNEKDKNQIKPQLIIQDELHLISGKLGSMVGFFELMIEKLCEDVVDGKVVKPKIIASTATISNSQNQIRSLYGRESNLFPPQLNKMGNSFFAKTNEEKKGRMYIGIFFSASTSQQITLSRLTAYVAQEPKLYLFDKKDPEIADMYWTSILYFNSTRELNQANTLIETNIRAILRKYYDRLGISLKNESEKHKRRFLYSDKGKVELTGRETESNLTKFFQRLQQNKIIGINDKEIKTSGGSLVDICLATNMIQVGIDISRLNIMIINGQPKTTSEYIQASSRVGRSKSDLGVVFTIYNTSKSRDRSHFERFNHYHSSVYSYVEPTSVTPFAKNLLERALHSVILTLLKLVGNKELEDRPLVEHLDENLINNIKVIVLERFKICEPEHYEVEKDEIEELVDDFFKKWKSLEPEIYGFMDISKLNKKPLLKPFNSSLDENWDDAIETLTNMRTVDGQAVVKINRNA